MSKKDNSLKNNKKLKKERDFSSIFSLGFEEFLKEVNSYFNKTNTVKNFTVEDTLSFQILENGLIDTKNGFYCKILEFFDRGYKDETEEEKERIFYSLSKILNSFDSSIKVQLFYSNQKNKNERLEKDIEVLKIKENVDEIYDEYNNILKEKLALNKTMRKRKFLIVGVKEIENSAKTRLKYLLNDIKKDFENFGVKSYVLEKEEIAELFYDILNIEKSSTFTEDIFQKNIIFDKKAKKRVFSKRLIAPKVVKIEEEFLKIGNFFARYEYINITGNDLSDEVLEKFLNLNENINISFHIVPIERSKATKRIRRTLNDLQSMKVTAQQKAVRGGYDMDLISSKLEENIKNVTKVLESVRENLEKFYQTTILISYYAKTKGTLKGIRNRIVKICSENDLELNTLPFLQEQGFTSNLPICKNEIEYDRYLTSSSLSVFIPFKTEELFDTNGIYYGINDLSKNLIMIDRMKLSTPNGLILGIPGKGKSFITKKEIINVFLNMDDEIIICDPEGEYTDLCENLGGEVIKLSINSNNYLNPLDINFNYGDNKNPIKSKIDFILSFFELVGGDDLSASEKSVIDRCLPKIYKKYFDNPIPENMPILEDLYNALKLEGRVGRELSEELEIYVTGSLNVFNNLTNIDLDKKFISFDIKELTDQIKKIGMLIVQDAVWNKLSKNRDKKIITRYYIDELHLLLWERQTAEFSVNIWKRFRKWGGIPTGITQNVKDFLLSGAVSSIFDNTDFVIMLGQGADEISVLKEKFKLSEEQTKKLLNANQGSGLIKYGNKIVSFSDDFPKNTKIYKMITTKFKE